MRLKRQHFRDYTVNALRLYFHLNKPATEGEAYGNLVLFEKHNNLKFNRCERENLVHDALCVHKLITELKATAADAEKADILSEVYINRNKGKGTINDAVIRVSLNHHMSTATVNRILRKCRLRYAEIRGLSTLSL